MKFSALYNGYFGLGKAEQEAVIFAEMVDSGEVDLAESRFDLALKLKVPQSKVQSLIYAYRLRRSDYGQDLKALSDNLKLDVARCTQEQLAFVIEDKYFKELLIARLKSTGVSTDTSFNTELIFIKSSKIAEVMAAVAGEQLSEISRGLRKMEVRFKVEQIGATILAIAKEYGPTFAQIIGAISGH
jgi:hypothetical protein